jgi:hypothetical protein
MAGANVGAASEATETAAAARAVRKRSMQMISDSLEKRAGGCRYDTRPLYRRGD